MKRRRSQSVPFTARLDRCAAAARRALTSGSVLLFLAAFAGLTPVNISAMSAPAMLAYGLWCALVLAMVGTAAARVAVRLTVHTTRATRKAMQAPGPEPRNL